jgi:hypothetical protein
MAARRKGKKKTKRRPGFVHVPGAGRNEAVRPGAGTHRAAHEKRAADRLRREVDERLEDDE